MVDEQCQDIKSLHLRGNTNRIHMKINKLSGKKKMINNGCIKSKDGKILMEKEEQLKRWTEYIRELYADNSRQEDFVIDAEIEGPPIMQSEVEHALSRTKGGKVAGPDS